jgi:hypothetical protein
MISRTVVILTIIGSVMLLAMAALHASGYSYITKSLIESDVPDFLKDILPTLFLYPSVVMVALVIFALSALRKKHAAVFFCCHFVSSSNKYCAGVHLGRFNSRWGFTVCNRSIFCGEFLGKQS